jgi:chromate reductase, NAD(P)H dehydrogenase (quinone)
MITVLVSTNRKGSVSAQIAQLYLDKLDANGEDSRVMSLEDLPSDFVFSALYEHAGRNTAFNAFVAKLIESDTFIIIVPEYNNSFPGVFKAFLDGMPYPNPLAGKWAALVGVSSGMQGASLALSHLTDVLNYLQVNVLAAKPKLAQIHLYLQEGKLENAIYHQFIDDQLKQLQKLSLSLKA